MAFGVLCTVNLPARLMSQDGGTCILLDPPRTLHAVWSTRSTESQTRGTSNAMLSMDTVNPTVNHTGIESYGEWWTGCLKVGFVE